MPKEFCPHCMQAVASGDLFCPRCGRDVDQQAAPHQIPVGTVLRSKTGHTFLFGEVKGEGGFGMTYIAKELSSNKVVAVKEYFPVRCQPQRGRNLAVIPATQCQDVYRQGMHSFLSEASMLRAVGEIRSIVHVMDYFEANSTAYMVMEYLDGVTLRDLLRRQSHLEPDSLLRKALPLMRDLERLHDAGVLHRDIAPDNIMLMPDGSLTLLDFGCARSIEDGRSMTVVLKPGFAPIEQYQTRGQGPYTDLYALCATLYYCLTGKVPPAAPERLTAAFDGQLDPLPAPSSLGAAISPEQERLLLWGLAVQPTDRPQSMGVLANQLEKTFVTHVPVLDSAVTAQLPENTVQSTLQKPDDGGSDGPASLWKRYGVKLLLGGAAVVILILLALLLGQ